MAVAPPDQVFVMNHGIEKEAPSPRCLSPTSLALRLESDEGIDCHGNERELLTEQVKFFNNALLSDICLLVEKEKFYAHKLILVRASQVFERMFTSEQWDSHKEKEVKLVEDSVCIGVFPRFLEFLYSGHIKLNINNTLPVLILANKYNVIDLRNVCEDFACFYIIPKVQLKDVFHVWFQYATKCYHQRLAKGCVEALAMKMDEIINSAEWRPEWLSLDKDQMMEILASSCLVVKDEYDLWLSVLKWLEAEKKIHDTNEKASKFESTMRSILESIRFPMMTPDQLNQVEVIPLIEQFKDMFQPILFQAYKYHALPLSTRIQTKEFTTKSFLLRNYINVRWDKRLVIPCLSLIPRGKEVCVRFSTRACWSHAKTWEWELKVQPKGSNMNPDDIKAVLYSKVVLKESRAVEYSLCVVNSTGLLHSVYGHNTYFNPEYFSETLLEKKVSVTELLQISSPLVVDDALLLQICFRQAE